MLKSLVKILGLAIGLVFSGFSYAVSMGDINVTNSLGEPLHVLIELGATGKDEASSLSARLAPPEVFKDAGLEYPVKLPPLSFKIETNANGESYIKITSEQPVNESFVNLLIELTWPSGRLLREYIFLLDPPGHATAQSQPAEVRPIEPNIVDVTELESRNRTVIDEAPPPLSETGMAEGEMKSADEISDPVKEVDEGSNDVSSGITVNRGDTLSQLALQAKPSEVSLERALVALYRANPDAFNGNMNRLKTGKILYMPGQSELDSLPQIEAVKTIRAEADDWHAYRQRLAAASGQVMEERSPRASSGKISTAVTDSVPEPGESAKEVVRLSRGEAPGDKASAGSNAKSLQNKIHALEEEAIAKNQALHESNQRVAALEKNIQDLQSLMDLKGQPPAVQGEPAQNLAVSNPGEVQPGAMQESPVAASEVVPSSEAAGTASLEEAAKPDIEPEAKKPSILDVILGNPLYMAGGAAALFGLLGLGYLLTQRDKDDKKGTRLGSKSTEPGIDPFQQAGMSSATPMETGHSPDAMMQTNAIRQGRMDDFDPISGADLFLSFGHEDQAEKILKEGLSKTPANPLIYLKLLSIYSNRNDALTFATFARRLKDLGDESSWEQAAAMGIKLDPDNPMYAGKGMQQ